MLSVHQRYGRTDRRSNGRMTYDSNTALALRASRGKNVTSDSGNDLSLVLISLTYFNRRCNHRRCAFMVIFGYIGNILVRTVCVGCSSS